MGTLQLKKKNKLRTVYSSRKIYFTELQWYKIVHFTVLFLFFANHQVAYKLIPFFILLKLLGVTKKFLGAPQNNASAPIFLMII